MIGFYIFAKMMVIKFEMMFDYDRQYKRGDCFFIINTGMDMYLYWTT